RRFGQPALRAGPPAPACAATTDGRATRAPAQPDPTAFPMTASDDIRSRVSRGDAVVVALAVLVLSFAGRRWVLLR
ncbi:MAG TPA: hypothetical protein VH274_01590, partial [Mycobacteriales bacterium]|nr:hypothetical protein [Mycobacteriales bacterium]